MPDRNQQSSSRDTRPLRSNLDLTSHPSPQVINRPVEVTYRQQSQSIEPVAIKFVPGGVYIDFPSSWDFNIDLTEFQIFHIYTKASRLLGQRTELAVPSEFKELLLSLYSEKRERQNTSLFSHCNTGILFPSPNLDIPSTPPDSDINPRTSTPYPDSNFDFFKDETLLQHESQQDTLEDEDRESSFGAGAESVGEVDDRMSTKDQERVNYEHRRTALQNRFTRIITVLGRHATRPLSEAQTDVLLDDLKMLTNDLTTHEGHVYELFTGQSLQDNIEANNNLIVHVDDSRVRANQIKLDFRPAAAPGGGGGGGPAIRIKLPNVELPKFTGGYKEFRPWLDKFNAMVHSNTSVQGVDKMSYLQMSTLGGPGESIVSQYAVTAGNYQTAYDALVAHFTHQRTIAYCLIKRLFRIQPVQQPTCRALTDLVAEITSAVQALQVAGQPTDQWGLVIIHTLRSKLDKETKREFDLSLLHNNIPTVDELTNFIKRRAQVLVDEEPSTRKNKPNHQNSQNSKSGSSNSQENESSPQEAKEVKKKPAECSFCGESHRNYECPKLLKLPFGRKKQIATEKNICVNCLSPYHEVSSCKKKNGCECGGRHNKSFHPPDKAQANTSSTSTQNKQSEEETKKKTPKTKQPQQQQDETSAMTAHTANQVASPFQSKTGLSVTAQVDVLDSEGNPHRKRALLDTGSQINFMSNKCAESLNLEIVDSVIILNGIANQKCGTTKGQVTTSINSIHNMWKSTYSFHILEKVSADITESFSVKETGWKHLEGLKLADPDFQCRGEVDLILGVEVFAAIVLGQKVTGLPGEPIALYTELGFVVMGLKMDKIPKEISSNVVDIVPDYSHFMIQESLSNVESPQTHEEELCESHFLETHSRDSTGRYQIRLPFKPGHPPLGNSKRQALSRFFSIEKKLERNPAEKILYHESIDQMIQSGIMEEIPTDQIPIDPGISFYLPHHYVLKESTSTKLRIVLDGSAKTDNNISLNDILMTGPTIQPQLIQTLMRFRTYKYVLSADISKMYHQILVHPDDRNYLRILWRKNSNEKLKEYRMTRVVFGLSPSPFLAIRSLQQLAKDEGHHFPLASIAILLHFYVDDLLTGAQDISTAKKLRDQLIDLTSKGKFHLCKWSSNCPELLEGIPETEREIQIPFEIESTDSLKTLGILWNPVTDSFHFKTHQPNQKEFTKREVASIFLRLYDPLGWAQPIVLHAKLILQDIWMSDNIGWDDTVRPDIQFRFKEYLSQLPAVEKIKIPRQIISNPAGKIQLHGFADASDRAIGAVIYVREKVNNNLWNSKLLIAKTKVVGKKIHLSSVDPKKDKISRLELEAALLLSELMDLVTSTLSLQIEKIYEWSDNSTVLHWLNGSPLRWKLYISNRVVKIHNLTSNHEWNYISTTENPADCISRGLDPNEIVTHDMWWTGPPWITSNIKLLPIPGSIDYKKTEEKTDFHLKIKAGLASPCDYQLLSIEKYSKWTKLIRTTAFVLRFIYNCKSKAAAERRIGPLEVSEIDEAERYWIRLAQSDLMKEMNKNKTNGQMVHLTPQLDSHNIIRVGGRLENSPLPYSAKHPIILPHEHPLVEILVRHYHQELKHANKTLLISSISRNFWIIGINKIVKNVIRSCMICHRFKETQGEQLMGQLPKSRVTFTRPFECTGVDYCGPFRVKYVNQRPTRSNPNPHYKCYVSLFICMSTKAVHLEVVTDASTAAFLAAVKRFISRRGKPKEFFSDNGKNFEGCDSQLEEFHNLVISQKHNETIADTLSIERIIWNFNPPYAPHHGGLWEAGVKSLKYHLKRELEKTMLDFEQFSTLLVEIEGILNSRPLTAQSRDPQDFQPITPAHFLIGQPIIEIPEPDTSHIKLNHLDRWQLITRIKNEFAQRWSQEYLQSLQQRSKWTEDQINMQVGELAIMIEDGKTPPEWPMCRIIKVNPGLDGLVRSVSIKTQDGREFHRPITRLIPLPFNQDESRSSITDPNRLTSNNQHTKKGKARMRKQQK